MGQKKAAAPKLSEEEKAAQKKLKECEKMIKHCKDDEVKKVEEAVSKGADVNWQNERGHTAAHVAAAFGALNVLRYLHSQGADLEMINEKKMTPLMAAKHIGEEDAALLIEAFLRGESGENIGKADEESDGEDDADPAKAAGDAEQKKTKGGAGASSSTAPRPELEVVEQAAADAGAELEVVDEKMSKAGSARGTAAAEEVKAPASEAAAAPYPVAAGA